MEEGCGDRWNLAQPCVSRGCSPSTDRRAEARAMPAEIYGSFTEGFDTADLKDAKALLDELKAWSSPLWF
jgi:hypothetical protein